MIATRLNDPTELKITSTPTLIALNLLLPLAMNVPLMMMNLLPIVTTIALNLTVIIEMIAVVTTTATIHAMTPREEMTLREEMILALLRADVMIVAIHDETMITTLPLLIAAPMTAETMITVEMTMILADRVLSMTVGGMIEETIVATTVTHPVAANLATKIETTIMMTAETLRSEIATMEIILILKWNQLLLLAPRTNLVHFCI